MGLLNAIGGLFKPVNKMVETVFGSRKAREAQSHQETIAGLGLDEATLMQFASEFAERKNRTWWDSFVDGLNRLPRPLLTIAVIGLFVLAPADPERFLFIASAFELIPPGFYALLSVIIGFYFGGRMQLKSQDFAVKGKVAETAKEFVAAKREVAKAFAEDEPMTEKAYRAAMADRSKPLSNKVILEWKKRRKEQKAKDD